MLRETKRNRFILSTIVSKNFLIQLKAKKIKYKTKQRKNMPQSSTEFEADVDYYRPQFLWLRSQGVQN